MKYLIPSLQARPGAVNLTEHEFRQLLADTQVGRTASRSHEEFCESLERIVNELRASTAAEPFLKPVSKKLAPDYDTYIKHPMDLSTVLKNVKSRMYKSKKSFARDLNLIWANCLQYNTLETHPIRAQAMLMKQKADHHLEFLVEPVESLNLLSNRSRPSTNEIISTKPTADGERSQPDGLFPDALKTSSVGEIIEEDIYIPRDYTLNKMPILPRALAAPENIPSTLKLNLSMMGRSEKMAVTSPLHGKPPCNGKSGDELDTKNVTLRHIPPVSAMATTADHQSASGTGPNGTVKRARIKSKGDSSKHMSHLIAANLNTLAEMRCQHSNLSALITGQHSKVVALPEIIKPADLGGSSRGVAGKDEISEDEACTGLEKATCALLAHSGLEGASAISLNCFVGVAGDYISAIGRTLRLALDRFSHEMTPEEMILHAVFENGGISVHDLDRYVRDDVERVGVKLRDVDKKLRQAMEDQPEPEVGEEMDENDMIFNGLPGMEDSMDFFGFHMPSIPRHLLIGKKPEVQARKDSDEPDEEHPPPPDLLPLLPEEIPLQIGLLQDFYRDHLAAQGTLADDSFDASLPPMSSMGIIALPKAAPTMKRKGTGTGLAAAAAMGVEEGHKKVKRAP